MTYPLLKFFHLLGLTLMGAGLIGVWFADLRRVFYDGVVVPGALLLLGSGTWLIVTVYGGWAFLRTPWLVGMVALFAFEFIEGNTITRLYFVRLNRLTTEALRQGTLPSELEEAPPWGLFSAPAAPPCAVTMVRTMARPIPSPSLWVV